MSTHSWLRLHGTRYRCVPQYLSLEELDPIARLFLDVLQYERRLSRLVHAFGLTERVVEDVLGDLIRKNRAALVIHQGVKEIRPLRQAVPNIIYERGESLDIWQEHTTGLILPAWIADTYDRPHGTENPLENLAPPLAMGRPLVPEFVKAPASQLIEMLIRADDTLRHREQTFGELDRLTDRYRVRPQSIWLPVFFADLQGHSIPLIATERIPPWVSRVWSLAMRRDSLRDPGDVVQFHTDITTADEGVRILNGWRSLTRLTNWREAVARFLKLVPSPTSGYDLREVREEEAALSSIFLSIGQVVLLEVSKRKSGHWLQSVIESSDNWVVVVLPLVEQIELMLTWLEQRSEASLPSSLILIVTKPFSESDKCLGRLRELLGPSRFVTVKEREWPTDGPCVGLGDGGIVTILTASRSAPIQFVSESFAAEWLSIIQALPDATGDRLGPDDEPIRQLRVRREATRVNDSALLGASEHSRSVAAVIDELRGFGERLLTAVVDPDVLMPEFSEAEVPRLKSDTFDRGRSLVEQLPGLWTQCEKLSYELSLAISPPWVFWSRLTSLELTPALVAILTEPGRRSVSGEIHILASAVSEETFGIETLLSRAVLERGWVINIGIAKTDSPDRHHPGHGILESIRSHIPSSRLRFWRLHRPPPAHAIILDDLVFIAGGDWTRPTVEQQFAATDFGFAIESREIAESFRSCFVDSVEIYQHIQPR